MKSTFRVERITIHIKSGKHSTELAYGMTSKAPEQADAEHVLRDNREHWSIENITHLRRRGR